MNIWCPKQFGDNCMQLQLGLTIQVCNGVIVHSKGYDELWNRLQLHIFGVNVRIVTIIVFYLQHTYH